MERKQSSRRKFLGSAAAGVFGALGGVATIGRASASSSWIPGTVSVHSSSGDWEYFVSVDGSGSDDPTVEKLPEADDDDVIQPANLSAYGQVDEGELDKYYFEDQIDGITAHHKASNASLTTHIGDPDYTRRKFVMGEDSGNSSFTYLFSVDNVNAEGDPYYADIEKGLQADDNDSVVDGSLASGFINAGGSDGYHIVGYIDNFAVHDPYMGGGSEGLSVLFNPD